MESNNGDGVLQSDQKDTAKWMLEQGGTKMIRKVMACLVALAMLIGSTSGLAAVNGWYKMSEEKQVETIQKHLIRLEYLTGKADGVMDDRTEKAIIDYKLYALEIPNPDSTIDFELYEAIRDDIVMAHVMMPEAGNQEHSNEKEQDNGRESLAEVWIEEAEYFTLKTPQEIVANETERLAAAAIAILYVSQEAGNKDAEIADFCRGFTELFMLEQSYGDVVLAVGAYKKNFTYTVLIYDDIVYIIEAYQSALLAGAEGDMLVTKVEMPGVRDWADGFLNFLEEQMQVSGKNAELSLKFYEVDAQECFDTIMMLVGE